MRRSMPLVSLMLFLFRYGRRGLHCICLSALLPVLFAWSGFAQSSTVTTYAGPPSPVPGAQATTQVFGESGSVCPDGAGGFYFGSLVHHRIYRVAADGTVRVVAGTGA